ncbi:MAG: hypothetical protein R2729_02135 [Bryobacteraceae bacterium]
MGAADLFLAAMAVYLAAGLSVAVWFTAFRLDRFDPAAQGAGVWFRILILPGLAALWPIVVARWWGKAPS